MGLMDKKRNFAVRALHSAVLLLVVGGCAIQRPMEVARERPIVAPASAGSDAQPLRLDASQIEPMYTEVVAIDLPTVVKVATAKNFDEAVENYFSMI